MSNELRDSAGAENWRHAVLEEHAKIKEAIQNLDQVSLKIALIVDEDGKLIGTLSDGDVRRGLLKGLVLESSIESIIYRNPFVVPDNLQSELVLQLMTVNKIQQIPIVDEEKRLIGLHIWDQLARPKERNNLIVIMAGGRGIRMHPHTEDCPKPMLEVDGKPMLEHIIQRAKAEGFGEFIISVHYLGHVIEDYFGDGSDHGVRIQYLCEKDPLGTAGALSLIQELPGLPFLITNGDVLSDIRYGELMDFHERHDADATMAVRLYEWEHPFGVVEMEGVEIKGILEKPVYRTHINAGVYVLDPKILQLMVKDEVCDMPALIDKAREDGYKTIAFPMHEPWLDVGRPIDLKRANDDKIQR